MENDLRRVHRQDGRELEGLELEAPELDARELEACEESGGKGASTG
jgi:hypothetical protein